MNCFLVDFENVGLEGIKDFNGVNEGDTFIIFYSENRKNITIDVMDRISELKLQFRGFKVETGTKNALDFQLSSYMGYLIGSNTNKDAQYYIVSKDKGFDCLCSYWKNMGITVKRVSLQDEVVTVPEEKEKPVAKNATPKKSKAKDINLATLDEIKVYVSDEDEPEEVLAIFNQYKTGQAICNGLSKKYKDSKRASAVYKKLKPLLKLKSKS